MTDGTYGVRYSEAQIDRGESWVKREIKQNQISRSKLNSAPEWLPFGRSRPATCFSQRLCNGVRVGCPTCQGSGWCLGGRMPVDGDWSTAWSGYHIRRTPLAGRAYEYYSEDPLLTAELATAMVSGLQQNGVGACLKHFACNNSEFQRTQMDSVVDERALRRSTCTRLSMWSAKRSRGW